MSVKKKIISGLLILVLFISIILIGYGGYNMHLRNQAFNFAEILENENIDDLSLTIYYMSPFVIGHFPISIESFSRLMEDQDRKIVISGSDLEEFINVFKQINNDVLIPVWWSSHLDVRLYYVLESRENGKLLDVAVWTNNRNIVVNGIEVRANPIFFDVILPFMPKDVAEQWSIWSSRGE